jgi:HD-GYP domain-containing protein (c-di-GMP phosphodiesterase class II)
VRQLNVATRLYLILVVVATVVVTAYTLRTSPHHDAVWEALVFLLLAAFADSRHLEISRNYFISPVPVVHVAMIIALPPGLVVIVALLAAVIEQVGHHRPAWYKAVFNIAHHGLIATIPALVLQQLWPASLHTTLDGVRPAQAVVVAVVLYYALDSVVLGGVIALASRQPLQSVLRHNYLPTALLDLTLASTGALLGVIWVQYPPLGVLVAGPVAVTHLAYRNLKRLERETLLAVEKMAAVVDARDPYTAGHCARVGIYAGWITEALGLVEEQATIIVSAARVHDLGKIGVPDAVLLKPGALTAEEFALMKRHADIGADLLSGYSVYTLGVELVRHHHERYDGGGYPMGLVGTDAPLGARIIAVADAFDAMTTDRPYRQGFTDAAALAELERGAGVQWDADIVQLFVQQARQRGRVVAAPLSDVAPVVA